MGTSRFLILFVLISLLAVSGCTSDVGSGSTDPDGDQPTDGDVLSDGDITTDGDTIDGDVTDGDEETTDGDSSDGDTADGDEEATPDGDESEADLDIEEEADSEDCTCSSGLCCSDGCHLDETDHICQENVPGQAQYQCASADCGGDLQIKLMKRYCDGVNTICLGAYQEGDWKLAQECTDIQKCNVGTNSCITDRPSCDPNYCAYDSGPCCENFTNTLHDTNHICAEDSDDEYGCPDGTACSEDVKHRYQDRFCTGLSPLCNGLEIWRDWTLVDDCAEYEVCVSGYENCILDRSTCDPEWCNSGDCCNTGTETIYGTDHICKMDIEEEYGCPDGTACGDDVKVRHKDKYCDGNVTTCNGILGEWKNWVLSDECNLNTEVCVVGQTTCQSDRPTCDSSYCSSGICCNTATDTIYASDHVCETNVESEYGCPDGTGCGDDLKIRFCKGNQEDCTALNCPCTGTLGPWKEWSLFLACEDTQQCNFASQNCDDTSFHDEVRCDGLDRYYYSECNVQEDFIESCDPCSINACSSSGCSENYYSCNSHGFCNSENDICTCTDPAYTGSYCEECATGYYEYPQGSGICVDDPCDPDPCHGHGTCDNSTGNSVCDCDNSYDGQWCNICFAESFGKYPYCFLPQDGYCETNPCWSAPTTGQSSCYNYFEVIECPGEAGSDSCHEVDFCGQDAQYSDSETNFTIETIEEDEVVLDSVTGLTWQRNIPDYNQYEGCESNGCTHSQAISYCESLQYAGSNEWRLPTIHELGSIIDYGTYYNAFDEVYFPFSTTHNGLWSSTNVVWGQTRAWTVALFLGIMVTGYKSGNYSVICVLDATRPIGNSNISQRYFNIDPMSDESVFIDAITGLQWGRVSEDRYDWKDSLSYCENLNFGGFTDWRLPNAKELVSLLNFDLHEPTSDFPGLVNTNLYWTSTAESNLATRAWIVKFNDGGTSTTSKDITNTNTLCVRTETSNGIPQ